MFINLRFFLKNTFKDSTLESLFLVLVFISACIYSLYNVTVGWNNPILDLHGFRQSQTALSIYYLLDGGAWFAYETPVLGAPWSIPFEFPLYQWIVAISVFILDTPIDQTGRFVSLVFYYSTLVPIYFILRGLGIHAIHCLIAMSLFLVSPLYLFWSRTVMIESTVLFLGMCYLASVSFYIRGKNGKLLITATIFGVLCALVKTTTFVGISIAAALLIVSKFAEEYKTEGIIGFIKNNISYIFFFALIPVISALYWVGFSDAHKEVNPLASFITSESLKGWNFGTFEHRVSTDLWVDAVLLRIVQSAIGSLSILIVTTIVLVFYDRRKMPYVGYVMSSVFVFLAYFMFFPRLNMVHDYYPYANGVFIVAALFFVILLLVRNDGVLKYLGYLIFICSIIGSVHHFYKKYYPLQSTEISGGILDVADQIQKHTNKEDVILVYGLDWNSGLVYYSQRRGLMDRENLSVESDKFKQAMTNLEGYNIGAMIMCRKSKKDIVKILARSEYLNLNSEPVYKSHSCDLYIQKEQI